LDLSSCTIEGEKGDPGNEDEKDMSDGEIIASGLEKNTFLEELNLSSNRLHCKGVADISEALEKNKKSKIKKLDLRCNRVSNSGAVKVAELLGANSTIETLDLSGNCLGREGAQALSDALEENTTLTALNLDSYEGAIPEIILKEIADRTKRNLKRKEEALKDESKPES